MNSQTHFGFETVPEAEKAERVRGVFDAVAPRYDLMNDLMSGGLHRLWKAFTLAQSGVQPGMDVLDIASGTGDLALGFAKRLKGQGRLVMSDINAAMLQRGQARLNDAGFLPEIMQCDAEALPWADGSFDVVSVAFGLRNMTHKDKALSEMRRVLRNGGRLLVLEFSRVARPLAPLYDWYSFKILPRLGRLIAGDADSYRYLAESIRMHPAQDELSAMLRTAGFAHVDCFNLTFGVCALHRGVVG